MMAYNSGFVASIIKDGKVFRESAENGTRTVRLPFDSEYKIRLQNKNNVRALVRVLIDGTEIHTGKFILRPNSSFDLERFMLDGDMDSGKKLKFVSVGHGDVQDPTAKENGLVEIIFEKEVEYSLTYNTTLGGILRGSSFKSNTGGLEGSSYCVNSNNTSYSNSGGAMGASNAGITTTSLDTFSDKGATVEGGQSSQQFQYSNEWFQTCAPVTIQIQIRGQKEKKQWSYRNVPDGFIVEHNDVKLSLVEEVSISKEYLTLRIPISQVQIGS